MKSTAAALLALLVSTAALAAQQPLTAKSFLPDEHRHIAFVDLAALLTQGIWDELEVSALKLVLKRIEKETGMAMRAIDRVTMVADTRDARPRSEGGPRVKQVMVVEGNVALGMPPGVRGNGEDVEVGPYTVRSRWGDLGVNPRPELYVYGTDEIVRPPLEGRPHRGTAAPDVMSLLAGRTPPLAYFVFDATAPIVREMVLPQAFGDVVWPADSAPTFLCVRLHATGDADDPHLAVDAIVRHGKEGDGTAMTARAFLALRDRLAAMPQMRAVAPVLKAMATKVDHADVVCSLDLGRARNAVGHLAALAALLFMQPVAPGEAQAAEVAEPPPPPPPEPKKGQG